MSLNRRKGSSSGWSQSLFPFMNGASGPGRNHGFSPGPKLQFSWMWKRTTANRQPNCRLNNRSTPKRTVVRIGIRCLQGLWLPPRYPFFGAS